VEIMMDSFDRPLAQPSRQLREVKNPVTAIVPTEIRVKGKPSLVPSITIDGRTVITTGKWLKTASVQDEDLVEGEVVSHPDEFISRLKESGLSADIFTFAQKIPETTPLHDFDLEWDNLAVIPISTYADWWEGRVDPGVRRAVRKAEKNGVVVKSVEFDDAFVEGIVSINNEAPVRQGKPFWHFQKSFEDVKKENSTYAERNEFLGAYLKDRLIGFIRMTTVDKTANIIQLLALMKDFDKRPGNALIAKAVEICEQRGMSHLVYCNYVYNDPKSSLTEFKRRNGFEMVLVPRYYVPLTVKGKVALSLRIHRGLAHSVPKPLLLRLLWIRSMWYARKAKAAEGTV
jgi:hypothetical protein